jgi:hypothetical protein
MTNSNLKLSTENHNQNLHVKINVHYFRSNNLSLISNALPLLLYIQMDVKLCQGADVLC